MTYPAPAFMSVMLTVWAKALAAKQVSSTIVPFKGLSIRIVLSPNRNFVAPEQNTKGIPPLRRGIHLSDIPWHAKGHYLSD